MVAGYFSLLEYICQYAWLTSGMKFSFYFVYACNTVLVPFEQDISPSLR